MTNVPVKAKATLPVGRSSDHFVMEMTMGRLTADELSRVITPFTGIKVISGEIHNLYCRIEGNSEESKSKATMLYDDFGIEFLKKDKESVNKFVTFFADHLILKKSNPLDGKTREGKGKVERDPYRTQFNYAFKAVAAAVKDIMI